jgi:predicted transcriptional regulator
MSEEVSMKVKVARVSTLKKALSLQEWQIAEIRNGVTEANQEKFATPKKIAAFFRKWKAL